MTTPTCNTSTNGGCTDPLVTHGPSICQTMSSGVIRSPVRLDHRREPHVLVIGSRGSGRRRSFRRITAPARGETGFPTEVPHLDSLLKGLYDMSTPNPVVFCEDVETECCESSPLPQLLRVTSSSDHTSTNGLVVMLLWDEDRGNWEQTDDVVCACGTMPKILPVGNNTTNMHFHCHDPEALFYLYDGEFLEANSSPGIVHPVSLDCESIEIEFEPKTYVFFEGTCDEETHVITWKLTG
jgi:hypothetical protein